MRIAWAVGAGLLLGSACGYTRDSAERTGAASEAQGVYCVLNAHTDVGTFHFQGPDWLLGSTEAMGPLELNLRLQQYVQPTMSSTLDVQLDPSAISNAVGYSMSERFEIQGGARHSLNPGERKRLEAYTAFQRTVWEIRDADCRVPLGTGASFKPIGVFFRVVNAVSVAIPELGFITSAPDESAAMAASALSQAAPATPVPAAPAVAVDPSVAAVDPGAPGVDYCIRNVHTDTETVHVEGPSSLLASVESAGPMTLDLRVIDLLIPTVTTSGRYKPRDSTVSNAVGYSVQDRYGMSDFARLVVEGGSFKRVEAYANYQRTVFDVFDTSCGTFLETGASYRPIGVYFKSVDAQDVALPDVGVHVMVPLPSTPVPVPVAGDSGAPAGDAGATSDAGTASDGGAPAGDAGAPDGDAGE